MQKIKIATIFSIIIFSAFFFFTENSFAAIIFQDNFDNQPEGASCDSADLTGWGGWGCFGGTTVTLDGVTHKSGEVIFPGRGGTGKSLKLWRHSGVFGDYTGVPYKGVGGDVWTTNLSNIYMRYYIKIPSAFVSSEDFKMWRLLTTGGGGEIYLNMRDPSGYSTTLARNNATLSIYDGGPWEVVLSNADLQAIWDGNWHSIEFYIGLNNNTLQVWIDGVLKYNNISRSWAVSGILNGLGHFALGNTYSHNGTWQNSWQAMELDDLVFADAYIGPVGGAPDTSTPTIPANLSATAVSSSQINLSWTASTDNVGVTGYRVYRNGSQINTTAGSPYSDTGLSPSTSYSYTVAAYDAAGNVSSQSSSVSATTQSGAITTFFTELFEDTNYASRNWYDSIGGALSTVEHISGSIRSFECRFLVGAAGCNGGSPARHLFTDSDSVYLSFWIKYSSNWTGSNQSYHPHQFHFLTNQNGSYDGLAYDRLTLYIEENEGRPQILIQDGQNIDESRIGVNLVNITENRSVAGCNGDSDGYGNGSCYLAGSVHWNGKGWPASGIYFQDTAGAYYKNNWHHIEAYVKLNSISGGKGIADGVVRYWYDNQLIIDRSNVTLRTAQYPNMRFNQFILAPWIGDGSPVDQTFWVDNLTVGNARPTSDTTPPAAPSGVSVN